jgi:hypothetical protein
MTEIPDNRCGFCFDASTVSGYGETCCWRPVWRDYDRCLWHTDVADKPREEMKELAANENNRLDGTILREISLVGVEWFENCTLLGAKIDGVDMRETDLRNVDLRESRLNDVDARRADFRDANLEDGSFTMTDLRGANLVGTRLDQTVFSNVRVSRSTEFGTISVYEQRLKNTDAEGEIERYAQAAVWHYREIQNLFETNALPVEARAYYMREKDMRRRIAWHVGNYPRALKAEGARWVTGYGMSPWRVLGTSLFVIVFSAIAFPTTGGLEESITRPGGTEQTIQWDIDRSETGQYRLLVFIFLRSLYFSTITFTTLGYGDIQPVGNIARAIAGIESLAGSLLMALLVFVLSRRIE